jgi:hypothetical protein
VLLIEVMPDGPLGSRLGRPALAYEPVDLWPQHPGQLTGRIVAAEQALRDYLGDRGLHRVGSALLSRGTLEVIATAAPGIEDILVLGKVKQLERAGVADLIIVDAPAAGHAVTFLQSARGLLDAVSSGPVRDQARDVCDLLADPARCQVMLVATAEETPVNELIDTAYALEDRVGVSLGPVVVNAVLDPGPPVPPGDDPLARAARFRAERVTEQSVQRARLAQRLPLEQLVLPFVSGADGPGPGPVERLRVRLLDAIGRLP